MTSSAPFLDTRYGSAVSCTVTDLNAYELPVNKTLRNLS